VDDHPIPSGNSAAAYGLLRLAALTGERGYEEHALGVFSLLGGVAAQHPQAVAHLLRAIDFHLAAVKEVALVAPRAERRTGGAIGHPRRRSAEGDGLGALAAVVRSTLRPHIVLAGGPEGTERPALMSGRTASDDRAAAYVCEHFTCQRPVAEPNELAALLGQPFA
jgi:uncharacterized protein